MNKVSKILCLVLFGIMAVSLVACGGKKDAGVSYTVYYADSALGNNWNPHSWETNADSDILGWLGDGFVSSAIKDSKEGVYQWVYDMATSVTDVTATHQDDLRKYKVNIPQGQTIENITQGYVFEIKLRTDAKWQNGVPINADDYIYSMQQLLNPKMHNYRANLYYTGESAVAGGYEYYYSESPIYECMVWHDENYDYEKGVEEGVVYISLTSKDYELSSTSLTDINTSRQVGKDELIDSLKGSANGYGMIKVTSENKAKVEELLEAVLNSYGIDNPEEIKEYSKEALFVLTGYGDKTSFDDVGCYKVDDYTFRYVCENPLSFGDSMVKFGSTWLVYKDYYEAGKDTSGELVTTDYGTKVENTMSYGPYMLQSFEPQKQAVYVQNPNWYGWEQGEDGTLVSYTEFEVDGERRQQYRATKVVVDVMTQPAQKQAFLKGQLDLWEPDADELVSYSSSPRLYKRDDSYTQSLFFHTNVNSLKKMDESKGNTNSVVVSNDNFRKAFSLCIDRAEFVTATPGYKPAFAILNSMYHYDIYEDPDSSYRRSDEAMRAIVNLYEIEYGPGKPYATLKEAHDSVTGYNLTEARRLMKIACDELVAQGLYTAGAPIHIRIGYAKGSLETMHYKQVELLNKYINLAVEGSGFGSITLEGVGNIEDRFGDTRNGEYAIGHGAWGGAYLYPFRGFRVYCDPDYAAIHEGGCWDPTTEELTININGRDITRTYQVWSASMLGSGEFAGSDNKTKLHITAALEENFLKKYYRIPISGFTNSTLVTYKFDYYTDNYNIMYGFGGFRLYKFNYNDAEWAAFVKSQNGELRYE